MMVVYFKITSKSHTSYLVPLTKVNCNFIIARIILNLMLFASCRGNIDYSSLNLSFLLLFQVCKCAKSFTSFKGPLAKHTYISMDTLTIWLLIPFGSIFLSLSVFRISIILLHIATGEYRNIIKPYCVSI